MSAEKTNGIGVGTWLFSLVLTIVVTGFIAFVIGRYSQPTPAPAPIKVDNTQALRDCMDKTVAPLESEAVLDPYQYKAGTIQEATNACKTEYPTQ